MPLISALNLPRIRLSRRRRGRMATLTVLCATLGLLLMPIYMIYKPPTFVIRYMQYRWPEVLFQVPTTRRVVALTIDDTPSIYTAEILALLTRYDATATFFVIGSQVDGRERQDVLVDIVKQGSELGNHAMYDEPARSLPDDVLEAQVMKVDGIIEETYSAAKRERMGKFFRPGSGFYSRRMVNLMQKIGYRLALGGIYPHDPQIPYPRINAAHVLSMVRPGGIIICHDRRSWTLPMLQRVLPKLQEKGYRVVSLSELLSDNP